MIYHKCSYRGAIKRYSPAFSVLKANINLHQKTIVEIQVDDVASKIIDDLRGLNGKKAKLSMFNFFVENHGYSFDYLASSFPTCTTEK